MIQATVFGTWAELKLYIIPATVFSYIVTTSLFFTITYISKSAFAKYPEAKFAVRRVLSCLITALIISNILMYVEWKLYNTWFAHLSGEHEKSVIFSNQVVTSILVTFVNLVFEIRHYILQWKNSAVEAERLQKENTLSQLESLRTQVSPHFLFNSFNALQSLIDTDTQKAKNFVQELSKVYRYVLEHKDDLVVEVKDEIAFIHSFIYLNKIRFGENLLFETKVEADTLNKYIPPLTLQLLVENAIKHNIISSDKPLQIRLYSADGNLMVENNLQLRTEKLYSTGIGLQNLKDRYKLIYNIEPEFTVTNGKYSACVPLMEKEK